MNMNPRHAEAAWARQCNEAAAKRIANEEALREILAADYLIRSNG